MTEKTKKKVIVIEETPLGSNIFETIGEEVTPIGRTNFRRKKNPDKKTIFQIENKWREKFSIVYYKGNNYLNVFVDAGTHPSRFVISRDKLGDLVSICTKYIDMLDKCNLEKTEKTEKKPSEQPPHAILVAEGAAL